MRNPFAKKDKTLQAAAIHHSAGSVYSCSGNCSGCSLHTNSHKVTLDKLPIGGQGVICAVGGEGPLRLRLLDMGLIPRTKVTMRKIAPMGDPIEIQVRGYELTLRIDDARKIQVSVGGPC